MNKRYFLYVALTGLVCALLFGLFLMGKAFFSFFTIHISQFEKFNGLAPILAGAIATIFAGKYLDKAISETHYIPQIFIYPVLIYIAGVVVGVFVNFLVNGLFDNNPMAYVTTPFIILLMYGVPAAMVVGFICFGVQKILLKKKLFN